MRNLLHFLLLLALCLASTAATAASSAAVTTPPRAGISAIWEPGRYNQMEVFWIDERGAVNVVWKGADYYWHQPQRITPYDWGMPGAQIKALWQVQNDQMEVFWVDGAGALSVVMKDHNGDWHAPAKLTGPGFAVPGSALTGFWQPVNHQLHVFGITADGALNAVYKANNKAWNPPVRMSASGSAVPGSMLTSVYQASGQQSQVFFTAPDGSVNLLWKAFNNNWDGPFPITRPGVAAAGAALDAVVYREYGGRAASYEQVEVFFTDKTGAAMVAYKTDLDVHRWGLDRITDAGYAPPGAPISAAMLPAANHLETFSIGQDGRLNDVWKENNGRWNAVLAAAKPGAAVAGNALSAVVLPDPLQLEVFYQDAKGAIWVAWKKGNEPWQAPAQLTGARGESLITRDYCLDYWSDWYAGRRPANANIGRDCQPFAPSVCREWSLLSSAYLHTSDDRILMPMFRIARNGADNSILIDSNGANIFGGTAISYKQTLGNPEDQLHGEIGNGHFNVRSGRISFNLYMWKTRKGDGSIPPYIYGGGISEILPAPDSGGVYAAMDGSFYTLDGKHPGSWFAPFVNYRPNGSSYRQMVVCTRDNLTIVPQPKPIKKTGRAKPPAPAPVADKPVHTTGKPRDPMPTAPSPAAGVSFSGSWVTRVQNGVIYNMTLTQDVTGRVSGDYGFGKISDGRVVGRDLYAVWTQGKASGTLLFHLAPDGTTFAGMWTQGDPATKPTAGNARGSWDGYSSNVFTKPNQTGEFLGTFALSKAPDSSEPLSLALDLGLNANAVAGRYDTGTLSGTVTHAMGRPTELALRIRDGATSGSGTFFLYPDGSGFSGYWHSSYAGLNAWSATLTAPPQAAAPPPAQIIPVPPPAAPEPVQPAVPAPPAAGPVPQGQCPAATAMVRQGLNIRNGAGGAVIGNVAGGTRVQCLACNDSWCLIAANDPRASVSRRYLDFEMPQPAKPVPPPVEAEAPPPPMQQAPPPAEEVKPQPANFAGDWWVRTSTGLVFQFHIAQKEQAAGGTFSDNMAGGGQFTASVADRTMTLQWFSSQGYAGIGTFTMHADGASFDGSYRPTQIPPIDMGNGALYRVPGTWESFVPVPKDDLPLDYGGCSACGGGDDDFVRPK